MAETYDVIIVGAGMAGGILAARIAERGINPRTGDRLKVALMDMGPYFKGDPKPGYGIPSRRQIYVNRPGMDDTDRVTTPWGTIAGIGGQSLHWGAQALLPIEVDHEDWVNETGVDWSYDKLTDARVEITEMFHIIPEPEEVLPPGAFKFRDAATKMGYKVYRYPAAKLNCIWCGLCAMRGCKYDAKSGSLVRYIPIAERNGVEILPDTMVEKVIIEKKGDGGIAKGVVYTRGGATQEARADHVILSCSNAGTPVLLFKSGYGPRDKVKNLIVENPNVGKNAKLTLEIYDYAVFDEPVKRADLGWGCGFYFRDQGPGGYMNIMIRDEFGTHGYRATTPHEMALNPIAPELGREHKQFMKNYLHFGHLRVRLDRENYVKGEVDARGQGIANPNHPEVVKRIQEGRAIAREVFLKMGARRTSDINKPIELRVTAGAGTCRGGADRSNSVINSDFECHDIENLFICDSGVFPRLSSTENGGATTAMMACHAWRRIVAKHFSRGVSGV